MDGVEGNGHRHEEEGSITVLNSLDGTITILEENNSEDGSDDCDNKLNIGGLGKANSVKEVSTQEQAKLIEPRYVVLLDILISYRFNFRVNGLVIIL